MNISILQLAVELVEKICKRVENGEISDLDVMAAEVNSDCKATSRQIIQHIIQEMNEGFRNEKELRKEFGIVIKEKDRPRELLTELGTICFKRDYFFDKKFEHYVTPLDQMLGIEKHERVGGAVSAALVSAATDYSYARSADIVTGGAVSRQTVRHQILKANIPQSEPAERMKEVKELHVYADEDHASMQKPNKEKGKKNKIVPLVTVTEGMREESKGRNRTINPMHFSDEKFDTKRLWKTVEGYIETAYSVDCIDNIYIHGDGGPWIKRGLESFSQSKHVIDGYHFFKRLKEICRIFPKKNVRIAITNALESNNRNKADEYIQQLLREPLTEKESECTCKFATYLFGNWEEIRRRIICNIPGSCTEGLISHMLSERISRNPMGWSEEALGKLVGARLYIKNGGILNKEIFREDNTPCSKYSEYADKFIEENIKGAIDFSLFDPEMPIFDGASGTQIAVRGIGMVRNTMIQ